MAASASMPTWVRAPMVAKVWTDVLQPAGQEGRAEHQHQVADDRTDQRCLDDVEHARAQGDQGDDQLGGIAERGVEKAADAFADPGRQLLGRIAVVQPASRRLADEGDRLAGDTGVLDQLLGLVRVVRVRLERVVVAEDRRAQQLAVVDLAKPP